MKCENTYEIAWWEAGKQFIVGLDEAGRGPLAGPLVVAGVIFPVGFHHDEIYDSKKLSESKREALYDEIKQLAVAYHIEIIEPKIIDEVNIYRATQQAMEKIVGQFHHVDGVLSDAMPLPNIHHEVISLVKGDQLSVSIAAASILAKVTRDRIMKEYDVQYPEYGFAKHKGYGTKQHLEALQKYGACAIHRQSYGPVAKTRQCHFDF